MDILFLVLATYAICGCVYSAVAVSNFKKNMNWNEDPATIKAGLVIAYMLAATFWPIYMYFDIKES